MPEWVKDVKDLSVGVIAVIGLIFIVYTYITKNNKVEAQKCQSGVCATQLIPHITDNIKVNTELVIMLRDQHDDFKKTSAQQQEALQGLILAVNKLVLITEHTFERVKEMDRR